MQDLTTAWRFLLRRPAATAAAVLTLATAVALGTLATGVIDQAFWRPADAARGSELVTIYNRRPAAPFYQTLSPPDYLDVRDRLQDRMDLAAFVRVENTLGGGEWPARVWGELVTGNYFSVLGARSIAGRLLNLEDDRRGDAVIVLGHAFWRRRFGANPALLGTTVRLGREPFVVVGIAAPGFHGPAWPSDYWIPLARARQVFGLEILSRSDAPILQTIGRPHRGVVGTQIDSRAGTIETFATRDGWKLGAFPAVYLRFWPAYRSSVAQFLGVFAGLSACILFIACANLAGLLLSRVGERQRELAVRQALGASRLQLARRLVAESVVLTVCGGAIGALLAAWGAALVTRVPLPVPATLSLTFDVRLALISLAVSLAASGLFTALSAWKGLATNAGTILAASATTLAPNAGVQRLLVTVQVALSCIALTVGGLLARSAWQVETVDAGFSAERGMLGRVALYDQGYTNTSGDVFYSQLQENLSAHPDIEAVALGWHAPVSPMRATARFTLAGSPDALQARYNVVSAGYFKTLGVRVLAGREFDRRDRRDGEPVAIVNESLAARVPGTAIGQTLRLANESTLRRIVGVVREIKYNGLTEPAQPFIYLPLAQAFRQDMFVHIRSREAGSEMLLRNELRRLDPNVALTDVRTLTEQLDAARTTPRASAMLSTIAAAIAVFLALVGVYGVLMTSVEQRQRELAIRAALGATPAEIVGRVVREGLTLTLAGVVLGMAASVQAGRYVTSLLFGVEPRDPFVMTIVPMLVLIASAIGWLAPARRASRVDPAAALREC